MAELLSNEQFRRAYDRLAAVSLNPRRHRAADARVHSEAVAALAARLGEASGRSAEEVALLRDAGHAHDIGKITGTARPERSLEVLSRCGVTEEALLGLVRWHDTSLPWYRSVQRGEAPSERAWRRLGREVDLGLLCLLMVADRVDAPGGWRRNAPTAWFNEAARARGAIDALTLDVDDHPSEVCAGAALVRGSGRARQVLVTRTRALGLELPKGGIEWDELPAEAALRELREESGLLGEPRVEGLLGQLDYLVGEGPSRHLKRVLYHRVRCEGDPGFGALPPRTRERRWLGSEEVDGAPLVNEGLRPLLQAALEASGAR